MSHDQDNQNSQDNQDDKGSYYKDWSHSICRNYIDERIITLDTTERYTLDTTERYTRAQVQLSVGHSI